MKRARLGRARRLAALAVLGCGAVSLAAGAWIPAKAAAAQWLMNRAWAASGGDRERVRPWPWADSWPVARLHMPGDGAPLIVLSGASGRNLAFAPAHVDGSAPPGHNGVSVIAGHRDTHFARLAGLEPGERFEIEQRDGAMLGYEVLSAEIVDARETAVRLDADSSLVVLVTCYPFDAATPGGPLRYVVTAAPGA